jgi:hypothetical protein
VPRIPVTRAFSPVPGIKGAMKDPTAPSIAPLIKIKIPAISDKAKAAVGFSDELKCDT